MILKTSLNERGGAFAIAVALGILFWALAAAGEGGAAERTQRTFPETGTADREKILSAFFTPPFRSSGLKVTEHDGARVLVMITVEEPLTPRKIRAYIESLLSRGVSVFGSAYYGDFSWDRTANDAAVTAVRKARGEDDTVQVSESVVRSSKSIMPVVPITVSDREIFIALSGDFGTVWRKIRIIPDTEPPAAEPRTGRYPGSRLRVIQQADGEKKHLSFVVKGDPKDVEMFFADALERVHRRVIVTGDLSKTPAQTEVFGIKTYGQEVVLAGYTYADKRLSFTSVTLRKAADPILSEYVEIEIEEN